MDWERAGGVVTGLIAAIEAHRPQWYRYNRDEISQGAIGTFDDKVLTSIELVRQIAAAMNADDMLRRLDRDTGMYAYPWDTAREAAVVLLTRIESRAQMAEIIGPSGPELSTSRFHPEVWDAAARLFDGGHYRQAVQNAGQALESHIQTVAGPQWTGVDLAKLFRGIGKSDSGEAIHHFGQLDPASDTYAVAREGAGALIRGAMMAVRNLVSHPGWPEPDETEALEMLAVLSYVAHLVDRSSAIEPS